MEKIAEELDFIEDVKHSGFPCVFLCLVLLLLFFIMIFINFYTSLSLKSKHPQNGIFKNM